MTLFVILRSVIIIFSYQFSIDWNAYFYRKNYKGYLLESRLHFRIHATRLSLSQLTEEEPGSDLLNEENESSSARKVTPDTPVKDATSFKTTEGDAANVDEGMSRTNGTMGVSWFITWY